MTVHCEERGGQFFCFGRRQQQNARAQGDGIILSLISLFCSLKSLVPGLGGGDWIGYWIAKATIQIGSYIKISFRLELAQIQLVLLSPTLLVTVTFVIRKSTCTWAREPVLLVLRAWPGCISLRMYQLPISLPRTP